MDMIVHVARTMTVDPSIDTIITDFRATMSELKCASSERLLRLGVSMAQLNIMYTLHRSGDMTMSHLADVLNVSFSSATGLIDRMEERDFIERIRVPEDRRIVVVRLTAAGRALLDEVDALSAELMRQVLVKLEPGQLEGMACAIADLRAAVESSTIATPDRHPVSTPAPRSPSTMRGVEGPSGAERTAHDLAHSHSRRD
jgi:DNA-binding MarR family transcriptional regulator